MTTIAFEVLGTLVINQDLEIVKVAFAVIAPRTSEELLDVGPSALLLVHHPANWAIELERRVRLSRCSNIALSESRKQIKRRMTTDDGLLATLEPSRC